jgi:cardiolipin synthase
LFELLLGEGLLLGDGPGAGATVARVIGWAFALWGAGLYWWAGVLYLIQPSEREVS